MNSDAGSGDFCRESGVPTGIHHHSSRVLLTFEAINGLFCGTGVHVVVDLSLQALFRMSSADLRRENKCWRSPYRESRYCTFRSMACLGLSGGGSSKFGRALSLLSQLSTKALGNNRLILLGSSFGCCRWRCWQLRTIPAAATKIAAREDEHKKKQLCENQCMEKPIAIFTCGH